MALAPMGQVPAKHHMLIINEIQKLADGYGDRLMICMPPGSAKSTYASRLAPAWLLSQKPNTQVIGASHTTKLAEDISRQVHGYIRGHENILGYSLETESAGLWSVTNGGRYMAAGVGSAIAGFRSDYAIVDDPMKGRKSADSEVERDTAWNWFTADLRTRLKPNAKIIVIMTRWHEDDVGGRLIEMQGGRWRVLKVPAEAAEDDPIGRQPGEWLWDDDTNYEYGRELREVKAEYEKSGAMRDWYSLYQQDPHPLDGSIFKIRNIEVLAAAPAGVKKTVRAWDLAATQKTGTRDPDWTTGLALSRYEDGRFLVENIERFRGGPDDVRQGIKNTAKRDGFSVRISLPQDPGQAGKTQVLYLTRELAGFRVESSPESGDKSTRAAPVASQVNVGNLSVVKADWNEPFIEELRSFPSGRHDDQVDALSRAFAMLIKPPAPARRTTIKIGNL